VIEKKRVRKGGNEMSGKPRKVRDDEPYDSAEEMPRAPATERLTPASDARRRLEDYWAQKALNEELKKIDDWDDENPAS
jgi:hypothetical protein